MDGFIRKYALPEYPYFRKILLRIEADGRLPILVERDARARQSRSFWAGEIHGGKLYGENACGVLLSKVRAALLWEAAEGRSNVVECDTGDSEQLFHLAREAEP